MGIDANVLQERKEEHMSAISLGVLGIAFIFGIVGMVFFLNRNMDLKTPTQGERFGEALIHLEKKGSIL